MSQEIMRLIISMMFIVFGLFGMLFAFSKEKSTIWYGCGRLPLKIFFLFILISSMIFTSEIVFPN